MLGVEEDAFLEVDDYRFFYYRSSSILERFMCRVVLDVIVPLFTRAEPEDESVAYTVL